MTNMHPGWFVVMALMLVATVMYMRLAWTGAAPVAGFRQRLRHAAMSRDGIGAAQYLNIYLIGMAFAFGWWPWLKIPLALSTFALLIWSLQSSERFKIVRFVTACDVLPPFYGLAWQSYRTNGGYAAIVPLNIVLGLLHDLADWLHCGWRRLPVSPHAAYLKGLRDGRGQVVNRLRRHREDPDWFQIVANHDRYDGTQ